ncbi:MAG: BrnT family toxin [Treponema sp.]|nr:BrnT family toxin [Treponema sp.]
MKLKFEWDERKNAENIKKHGVSFEEATAVFIDPLRFEMYDSIHSFTEKRWITIGLAGFQILKVSFTERNDKIRLISARKANNKNMEEYFYGYGTTGN